MSMIRPDAKGMCRIRHDDSRNECPVNGQAAVDFSRVSRAVCSKLSLPGLGQTRLEVKGKVSADLT